MRHDPAELRRFTSGETRFIMAAYRDPARRDLYLLPDGQANERRVWAKENLRCFVAGCTEPEVTTVSRKVYRDGFKHTARGEGSHNPESVNHIQGKAVLAAWLQEQHPDAVVAIEHGIDTQRSRVADVLLTRNGHRVAFEVQYSAITVAEWTERHNSYRAHGVVDVWLWGHTGHQLKVSRANQVATNHTHQALVGSGLPLIWFNPDAGMVGTAVVAASSSGYQFPHPDLTDSRGNSQPARFVTATLDEMRVTPSGLSNPFLDSALSATAAALALVRAQQEEQMRRAAVVDAQMRALRAARAHPALAESTKSWFASDVYRERLDHFNGEWPDWLSVDVDLDLPLPDSEWQSELYWRYVKDRPSGTALEVGVMLVAMRGLLQRWGSRETELITAIMSSHRALTSAGILRGNTRLEGNGASVVWHRVA